MSWDWDYAFSILPELLWGMGYTAIVTLAASTISLIGGLIIAIAMVEGGPVLRLACRGAVEVVRGVPVLVFLYFGYYLLPGQGLTFPAVYIGIVTLGVVYAGYCSEVFRAALNAVGPPMRDACSAVGLSQRDMWITVVVPLAVRSSLAPLMNYVILLFRQSSFLFAIGVPVLLGAAQLQGYLSFRYLEPFTIAALMYLVLNIPFLWILKHLETKHVQR